MKYGKLLSCFLVAAVVALPQVSHAAETNSAPASIGAIQVPVAIVSPAWAPSSGLRSEDFHLQIDGSSVGKLSLETVESRDIILVFDRLSLEKRSLKEVLETLNAWLKKGLPKQTKVAVFLGGQELDLVQRPTAEISLLTEALTKVGDAEYLGEKFRGMKRTLTRSVSSAQTYKSGVFKPSSGNAQIDKRDITDAFGGMQAKQYVDRVNGLRDQEMGRILQELLNIEMLIRGSGGTPGRSDIVWIGEDFFSTPGLDVYSALFQNFQAFRTTANLKVPSMWSQEKNLNAQFKTVSRLAQGMGVRVHILDAADRGRYASDRRNENQNRSGIDTYNQGDPRNMVMDQTGAETQDLVSGGNILARGSGGIYFYGSRDTAPFFDKLDALVNGSYLLSFDVPGGKLDGTLHDFEVKVDKADLVVKSPHQFAAAHPLSRLSDLANAEAILHLGENGLGFEIDAGQLNATQDGRQIEDFKMILPVDRFKFIDKDGTSTAHLAVAVVMKGSNASADRPKIFKLPISVPSEQISGVRKIASSFRLLLDKDVEEISFAVLDELSGRRGSMTLKMKK